VETFSRPETLQAVRQSRWLTAIEWPGSLTAFRCWPTGERYISPARPSGGQPSGGMREDSGYFCTPWCVQLSIISSSHRGRPGMPVSCRGCRAHLSPGHFNSCRCFCLPCRAPASAFRPDRPARPLARSMITKIPQRITCKIYVIMGQSGSGSACPAAPGLHGPLASRYCAIQVKSFPGRAGQTGRARRPPANTVNGSWRCGRAGA
jgi:hypothetical protein